MRVSGGCVYRSLVVVTMAFATFAAVPSDVSAQGFPTIDGAFSGVGSIGPGGVLELTVLGRGGVPASGVDAVAINVTATGSTSESFLTVYPTGTARPMASNLNFTAGRTNPNMVIAKIGASGRISIFNLVGNVDVVVDVQGWFPAGGGFTSLGPARLFESRAGLSTVDGRYAAAGALGAGQIAELVVVGRGGVPEAGVDAVALNVTATGPSLGTFLTLWPTGEPRPTASNVNVATGETRPNMVIAKVGVGGSVSVFNFSGRTDVVIDVLGWFPTGGGFTSVTPARVLESRPGLSTVDGQYNGTGKIGDASVQQFQVLGRGGVPASGVGAVAVNITATGSTAESYLTVWPTGASRPTASNLNYVAGQTSPNMAIVPLGADGLISLFNFAGSVDVVVDVLGWFPPSSGFVGVVPARLLDTRSVPAAAPAPGPGPAAPPTPGQAVVTLRPGTLIVGTDVAPGRYVADARRGCYWERLKGFSGSFGDIIANDFQGFAGRAIVDILPTDVGFEFDADCGTFQTYVPPPTPSSTIAPGAHVVGAHVTAGAYVAAAMPGCYWERVRSFDGNSASVIANDFVSSGGQVIVTISPSDVGFVADADCGTWIRL